MVFLSSLKLHEYRCYEQLSLNGLADGFLVFYGANGAGKTNVLEAVSLLSPGRGLRGVKPSEIQRQGTQSQQPWAVSVSLETQHGPVQVGTGFDVHKDKRVVRIAGENARSQSALAEYLSCIWLTPQMDRLFLDSAGHRRKFLDRLIFAFDPGHSGRVTRYENAMRQRSKVLQGDQVADPVWLSGLEAQMAETAVAIAAARLEFTQRLQVVSDSRETDHFPRARLHARGTLEELLGSAPALEVEDLFKHQLSESRGVDMLTGGAATGPHKSDLSVFYAEKDMRADQCSTGEQKALLIGIILSHAQLVADERGQPPILLLDEVAAHLDEGRRAALYDLLGALGGQVWLTGTDRGLFEALEGKAQFFEVRDSNAFACSGE